jgi:hypothetical protein
MSWLEKVIFKVASDKKCSILKKKLLNELHKLQWAEKKEKRKKKPWRHIKALIIIPVGPSERSWWEEFNDIILKRSPKMTGVSHTFRPKISKSPTTYDPL